MRDGFLADIAELPMRLRHGLIRGQVVSNLSPELSINALPFSFLQLVQE